MVRKNLANIVSILGVLPLCLLFGEHRFQYLLPLIVYNNVMDDLDGVLAVKLNIGSRFGALLDNVCDAISHAMFMMIVGMHFSQEIGSGQTGFSFLGLVCLTACLLATIAITVRGVARLDPEYSKKAGSPTNELIRHVFFILLLSQIFSFDPTWCLILASVFHSISMLAPLQNALLDSRLV